eukprot:Nk52_evm18s219 gene=Nk52_evmTU18s219
MNEMGNALEKKTPPSNACDGLDSRMFSGLTHDLFAARDMDQEHILPSELIQRYQETFGDFRLLPQSTVREIGKRGDKKAASQTDVYGKVIPDPYFRQGLTIIGNKTNVLVMNGDMDTATIFPIANQFAEEIRFSGESKKNFSRLVLAKVHMAEHWVFKDECGQSNIIWMLQRGNLIPQDSSFMNSPPCLAEPAPLLQDFQDHFCAAGKVFENVYGD